MLNKKNYILFFILIVLIGAAYLYAGPFKKWQEEKKQAGYRNFLSHINMDLVTKVEVTDADEKKHIIDKVNGSWSVEPYQWPAEQIIMDALEEKMKAIISDDFEVASLNPNNKINFQTGDNGMKVKLFQNETEVGNFIIGKVTSDYQGTYISRENDDKTYKVRETLVRAFDVESWRDLTITDISATVDTVILKYPTQEIELTNLPDSRGEVYWRSIRPYLVRLDKEKINALINAVKALEASAIPEQDASLAGFDNPALQIQLKGEGVDETVLIGKKNNTNEYFVKKLNDNKIYLIAKENRDELAKQIIDLARGQGFEPRLPGPKPGVLPLDDPRK